MHFEGWNGYMQKIKNSKNFETSLIDFLPFIYSPPSDTITLYNCLLQSCDRASKMGIKTVIVTFDQPLYWKARAILEAASESFTRFRTILSFLAAFDHIMAGSGLKEAIIICYAENSTELMLKGKAYARAVCAHHLT